MLLISLRFRGAYSVGAHLVTNNGNNEGLFRAGTKTPSFPHLEEYLTRDPAIMESGNAVGPPYNGTEWHQPMYNRIVQRTGSVSPQKSYGDYRN